MLSVFYDVPGVVCWELLPSGASINSQVYNQLQELSHAFQIKRSHPDKIYFLRDSAKPHCSKMTRQRLQLLGVGSDSPPTFLNRPWPNWLPFVPIASSLSGTKTIRCRAAKKKKSLRHVSNRNPRISIAAATIPFRQLSTKMGDFSMSKASLIKV